MIVTISGPAGSGKSTIANKLAEKLGWKRYYIGGLRRDAAKKMGITLAEYNKLGEKDPTTDREVDEYQKELGLKEDNFIIEGRTSWYFIPHSLKIYIDVDEFEGARRVYESLKEKSEERNEDNNLKTVIDVLASHKERKESDNRRYKLYYNINVYDPRHYDFTIDTTNKLPDEVLKELYRFIQSRIEKESV